MSNLYAFTLCAASAWSKKCILVHFVFASTLRCLLPDWQYKQKKTQQLHYKRFCNFLSVFLPNLISPDLLRYLISLASKTSWTSASILQASPISFRKYILYARAIITRGLYFFTAKNGGLFSSWKSKNHFDSIMRTKPFYCDLCNANFSQQQ